MKGEAWITGIGVVSAWGVGLEANLRAWKEGRPLEGKLDDAALDRALAGLPDERLRHADRVGKLAVAAARLALEDAKLPPPYTDVALSLGVGFGTYAVNAAHQKRILKEGLRFASPAEFTLTLPNITTSFVSMVFGIRGETTTFCDGALAGASALGHALDLVRSGVSPVLAGAADCQDESLLALFDSVAHGRAGAADLATILVIEAGQTAAARRHLGRARFIEQTSHSAWGLDGDPTGAQRARKFIKVDMATAEGWNTVPADPKWPSGEIRSRPRSGGGGTGCPFEVGLLAAAGLPSRPSWTSEAITAGQSSLQTSILRFGSIGSP
ncbi:MAG: hypothetical protein L0216_20020 [Planctomycetales bacterium]|nr:hypothetical protein [Planctomycetales bacterium]